MFSKMAAMRHMQYFKLRGLKESLGWEGFSHSLRPLLIWESEVAPPPQPLCRPSGRRVSLPQTPAAGFLEVTHQGVPGADGMALSLG